MKIEVFGDFFAWVNIKHGLISAVLYFILVVPFKYIFALIPGSEVKAAAFFPVVVGLLWGPAAAIGTATANFAGDIIAGHELYIAITGATANFFQAYIPYKLWYTFHAREKAEYLLHDMKSIFKYIYILTFTSFTVSAMLAMAGESGQTFTGSEMFLQFFIGQMDSALVIGTPLLILCSHQRVKPCLPKTKKRPTRPARYYDFLLVLVIGIEFAYIYAANQNPLIRETFAAFYCWIAMFLLLSVFMQKPIYDREEKEDTAYEMRNPLLRKATKFTIFGAVSLLAFIGSVSYSIFQNAAREDYAHVWNYLCATLLWAVHLIFAFSLIFLWQVEKKVIKPLQCLNQRVSQRNRQPNAADTNRFDESDPPCGDEIDRLTRSLHFLIGYDNRDDEERTETAGIQK